MAEERRWPALHIRSRDIDHDGVLEGLVAAALHDEPPLAIHDLHPPSIPPGGLWDPTAVPTPEPPTRLAWRACFADAASRNRAAAAVAALGRGLTAEPTDMADDDWVRQSQQGLTAVDAGAFVVAPPWDTPATSPHGRTVIVIEPSMGFGTGHHQSTRLCLRALGTLDLAGRSVIDLGTGSGVLALAAASLGASDVLAVDIDPEAIDAARRSAALNPQWPTPRFEVGDVFATSHTGADLVFANLTGAMLVRAASAIEALVAPSGHLIVSGFVQGERAGVEAGLSGCSVVARLEEDEWCAAVLRRG